jgi:hypothetical protein
MTDIVHTAEEAAELKKYVEKDDTDKPFITWFSHLWNNVPAAITYANANPISQPGSIDFNVRDNGQVWTYDRH